MQITFYGKHLSIGDSLKKHVQDSFHSREIKRSAKATLATVTFAKKGAFFMTEVIVHDGTHHNTIVGHGEDVDPYHSADIAMTKIEKQLNKHQDKMKNHHKTIKEERQLELVQHIEEDMEEEGDNPVIVAEKVSTIQRLSVREAVMKMAVAKSNMFIFINSISNHLNVLSYRSDGNISWVDTKMKGA